MNKRLPHHPKWISVALPQQLRNKHLERLLCRVRYGLGVFILLWLSTSFAEVEIPPLAQHVTDLTATLSDAERNALEATLTEVEAQKGSQIAVLIVPSTAPEDIAQYSIRVADAWKIGRKKIDDGVILIIAKNDRKLRIEVGYGLEGAIPDAIAKRIIAETITPYFKAGDFVGGINAGVGQIIKVITGEPLPEPTPQVGNQADSDGLFMLILMGGLAAGAFLSMLLSRVSGGLLAGLGSGLVAAGLIGSMAAMMIGLIVFFIIAVRHTGGSGWSNGGGFGGGGFGGGSGGSSWGGGGGGFGGGGASGSW